MSDTQLLSEIGRALYGEHWETTLSRQMAVSDRSMRRWANGTDRIPWGVWFDVYREVKSRAQNLDHWSKVLYDRVVIRECEFRPENKFNPETDWYFEVHDPESGRHSRERHYPGSQYYSRSPSKRSCHPCASPKLATLML
jgi:hypothetical protein